MEKFELLKPILTIFDGSNFLLWTDEICSFLKGRKLCRLVIGEITKPIKKDDGKDDDFFERFED